MQINTFNVVENFHIGDPIIHSFKGDERGYSEARDLFEKLSEQNYKNTFEPKHLITRKDGLYINGFYSVGVFNSVDAPKDETDKIMDVINKKVSEPVKHIIHEFIKDKDDNRVGCFLGIGNENGFSVGWSLCHKGDIFDKVTAYNMALKRATPPMTSENIPDSLLEFNKYFVNRCKRYFKIKDSAAVDKWEYVKVTNESCVPCCFWIYDEKYEGKVCKHPSGKDNCSYCAENGVMCKKV